MEDKINILINKIKLFKSNTFYRLGDVIFQYDKVKGIHKKILDDDKYNNTILKNYIVENKSMNSKYIKHFLIIAINKKINTLESFTFPKNDELVIHLRLGDVIFHPKRYMVKNYEKIINKYIIKYNIKYVSIVTAFNYAGYTNYKYTDEKQNNNIIHIKNLLNKLISIFNTIHFDIISNDDADLDFIYMYKSKYFVEDISMYSKLITKIK